MWTCVFDLQTKTPLYAQLYDALKQDILSGRIKGGEKLPSKRALAEHLSISRSTVETAYEQLLAEGYILSRPRSGFYAEMLEHLPVPSEALHIAPEPEVPLSGSSTSHFPFSVWAKLMRTVLAEDKLLLSVPNTGLPRLRCAIAGMLRRSRGMTVEPQQIIVGAGTEYFYNILVQLLGREQLYGIEDPGHRTLRYAYEAAGAAVQPIGLDESGVNMAALEHSSATVLHLSPGHQYPTGLVTPIGRRRQLMAWVTQQERRWLVEDEYDSEFRFTGRIIPTMFSMDTAGRVIYLNTFSKTISPALRISYMILPAALMAQYRSKLGFYSCPVPGAEQLTLAKFLDDGYFEKQISRMKRHYRLLRDEFLGLLRRSPKAKRITVQGQDAGLHFLLALDTPFSEEEIERRLAEAGVRAVSLRSYAYDPATVPKGRIVLHYSDLEQAQLPALLAALEALV